MLRTIAAVKFFEDRSNRSQAVVIGQRFFAKLRNHGFSTMESRAIGQGSEIIVRVRRHLQNSEEASLLVDDILIEVPVIEARIHKRRHTQTESKTPSEKEDAHAKSRGHDIVDGAVEIDHLRPEPFRNVFEARPIEK